MPALQTELAWGGICTKRGEPRAARRHYEQARARITDAMLPQPRAALLTQIEQALSALPKDA